MTNLDTIKMSVPYQFVKDWNKDYFVENQRIEHDTGLVSSLFKAKSDRLPVGISSIQGMENGEFQVKFSAKTLKDNYLQGINRNTIFQSLESFNPVLQMDVHGLLESNPKVYSCDSTDNVSLDRIGANQKDVCTALLMSRSNPFFEPIFYNSRKKLGVEFHGRQKEKNRLIAYSKNLDLLKSDNKRFMKECSNPSFMLRQSENIIRIEANHTTFRSIRNRFKVRSNSLMDILNSSKPVNHDFLLKVMNGKHNVQYPLFDEFKQFNGSGTDFVMIKGIEYIVHSLEANERICKEFFKDIFKEQFKYHYYVKNNSIKNIIASMKTRIYEMDVDKGMSIADNVLIALKELALAS